MGSLTVGGISSVRLAMWGISSVGVINSVGGISSLGGISSGGISSIGLAVWRH